MAPKAALNRLDYKPTPFLIDQVSSALNSLSPTRFVLHSPWDACAAGAPPASREREASRSLAEASTGLFR